MSNTTAQNTKAQNTKASTGRSRRIVGAAIATIGLLGTLPTIVAAEEDPIVIDFQDGFELDLELSPLEEDVFTPDLIDDIVFCLPTPFDPCDPGNVDPSPEDPVEPGPVFPVPTDDLGICDDLLDCIEPPIELAPFDDFEICDITDGCGDDDDDPIDDEAIPGDDDDEPGDDDEVPGDDDGEPTDDDEDEDDGEEDPEGPEVGPETPEPGDIDEPVPGNPDFTG